MQRFEFVSDQEIEEIRIRAALFVEIADGLGVGQGIGLRPTSSMSTRLPRSALAAMTPAGPVPTMIASNTTASNEAMFAHEIRTLQIFGGGLQEAA